MLIIVSDSLANIKRNQKLINCKIINIPRKLDLDKAVLEWFWVGESLKLSPFHNHREEHGRTFPDSPL